jgi:hypothetical protein
MSVCMCLCVCVCVVCVCVCVQIERVPFAGFSAMSCLEGSNGRVHLCVCMLTD